MGWLPATLEATIGQDVEIVGAVLKGVVAEPKSEALAGKLRLPRELWKRVEVGELMIMNQLWVRKRWWSVHCR